MIVQWKKPPKQGAGRAMALVVDQDVAELKKNPGAWALVRKDAKTSSSARTYKDRGCVAVSHRTNTAPPRFDIYAMWPDDDDSVVKGDDALVDAIGDDCG